jgi:uncharacterized protein YecT (DUF1311 family)
MDDAILLHQLQIIAGKTAAMKKNQHGWIVFQNAIGW